MVTPDRWRPSPFIRISLLLHLAAVLALVVQPALWRWWLGILIADHLALTFASLWPRSSALGQNMLRLPAAAIERKEISITIDDGPDPEVTPLVLDVLDRYQASASFFVIGERVARYPDLANEIVRRGHSVENHSQRHSHLFSLYGPRAYRREIEHAQSSIRNATGSAPMFFRAPAGLRNPLLDQALNRLGLCLVSWTRRGFDTVSTDFQTVMQRLIKNLAPGDILLLHDGHAAKTADGSPVVLEVLPSLLEHLLASGLKPVTLRQAMMK